MKKIAISLFLLICSSQSFTGFGQSKSREATRKSSIGSPARIIRVDSGKEWIDRKPNQPFEQWKPNPLLLVVRVKDGHKVYLNNEPQGTISTPVILIKKLAHLFRARVQQQVYRIGTTETETTVWINTHGGLLTESNLQKLVNTIERSGADPIKITDEGGSFGPDAQPSIKKNKSAVPVLATLVNDPALVPPTIQMKTGAGKSNSKVEKHAGRRATMDEEGRNEAWKYWHKYLIKCGSSYFYQPNGYVIEELRDTPRFHLDGGPLQPKHLSRADELNGVDPLPVEWQASSWVEFSAVKEHREEGSHGWQTGTNTRWAVTIRRIKGTWEVPTAREINCAQMQGLK